ncbi:hypothetical protein ABZ770_16640 [Streptomyces sp. NPDC006654]|uniref:hypothetical protein n=1 Tax=Streptomyces sp. NPDC006654 TaxID=3156897 RepID=UPI0033F820CD
METASASSAAILSAPAGPPGDASEGPSPSNRPNKPMLAAAALVGVVLLAVPLLLTAGDKDKTDTRRHVPQDAVLAGGGTAETTGAYVPDQADDGSKSATAQQKDSGRHTQAKQKKGDEPDSPVQGTERGGNHPSGDGSTGVHGETARPENKTTQKTARTSAQTSAKVEKTASAPTWEKTARQFSNGHSGMCLSRIGPGRFVGESGCGSDTWKRLVLGTGYVLIKHVQSDMCLDTDENELYVSPCTDKDPGQRWRTPSAGGCTVYLQSIGNRYLTGWNTNTASMRLKDDADDPAKQKWRVSPSVSNGC